ncbi:hypothetical protein BDB00DRAFT_940742 [Zychaea mexicana]|uniref:uncharacterized protein n=1 Tax=Zychaea mexicana TaxID=64656 RepID=UPI0022FEAEDD|nr:uncharacterized protein BDB00DRAFT_940742 [Zychaea mexicana]KAI9490796.1 hypothetical protein BDB00DRAFT_940742 [Zychaea mexicana]
MVRLGSFVGALTLSFVVAQAAPIQNEVAGLIHAQSFSELKHEAFVPMQKLGQNGMPVKNKNPAPVVAATAEDAAAEDHRVISAAAIDMPFRPIMVNRKNLVGMDDMGKVQTLAVPMTVIGGGNDAADAATASVAAPSAASSVIASMPKYH